jgi:hypothetical protein
MPRIVDVATGLRSLLTRPSNRRAICVVAIVLTAVSCGEPQWSDYDPPPGFALRETTPYPNIQAKYAGAKFRLERVIDIDDPRFSPQGSIYSGFGWVYWGKWTYFEGMRWPATWDFYTIDGCGSTPVPSNFSISFHHKLYDVECVPRTSASMVLSPNSYSVGTPPGTLNLSFDTTEVPSGTAAAVWIVDGAETTVIQETDTTVWDGSAQVPTPNLSPGSYKVLIEFDSIDVDGGSADLTVSSETSATFLTGGWTLGPEGSVSSPSGRFVLKYQSDGNLVLYDNGSAAWAINCWPDCNSSGFQGNPFQPAGYATMQTDGNFVVYNSYGNPVWHTWTFGNPGAYLAVKDDGGLVVYSNGGTELWSR